MRDLFITPEAFADLEEISAHIAQDDPVTAQAVIERIESSIDVVRSFPNVAKPTRKPNIYVYGGTPKQPFRFTFRYSDDRLEVIRVFRASRRSVQF